jgi:aspartate/methionine/tyrosine aminotransferase
MSPVDSVGSSSKSFTSVADLLKPPATPHFKDVPETGVIFVMHEAQKRGFYYGNPEWVNFGQGAPETGAIPDAPPRVETIHITDADQEYAPIDGIVELREAVANLYNQRYRKGKASQYTKNNVCITPGGRAGLTRLVSTLGLMNLGHFLPDYTAYQQLLGTFTGFYSVPILLDPKTGYRLSRQELREKILHLGLSGILLSNPCNPTGRLLHTEELRDWMETCRKLDTVFIADEFYSHYIWSTNATSVSSASYVEDVNVDDVCIVDGLTKNFRYPGWRVSWVLAPEHVIRGMASAGSYLDGGCAQPMQKAAIPLLSVENADAEAKAVQKHFSLKRAFLLDEFARIGIQCTSQPEGSFYIWAYLGDLPKSINTGLKFFEACLEENVITVPGYFFDVNPRGRRPANRASRFRHYCRMSFGPSMKDLTLGISKLEKVIQRATADAELEHSTSD